MNVMMISIEKEMVTSIEKEERLGNNESFPA